MSIIFQFHKGTIKTIALLPSVPLMPSLFQFHKGTIKTAAEEENLKGVLYFNSIKVQLKLVAQFYRNILEVFQFHKGTIKTLKVPEQRRFCQISIP